MAPPKTEKPKLPTSGARVAERIAEPSAPPPAAAGAGPDQQVTASRKGGFSISHAPVGAPGKARVIESLDPEIAAPTGPRVKATTSTTTKSIDAAAKTSSKAASKTAKGDAKGEAKGEVEPEARDVIAELLPYKKQIAAALAVIVLIVVVAVSSSGDDDDDKPTEQAAAEKLLTHQNDLTEKGKFEADDTVAIKILTSSILLGPDAPGARDAYLERARRSFHIGDRVGAAQDIAELRKRSDVEPILGQIQAVLDEHDRSKKP
jgi:hypothetical protein